MQARSVFWGLSCVAAASHSCTRACVGAQQEPKVHCITVSSAAAGRAQAPGAEGGSQLVTQVPKGGGLQRFAQALGHGGRAPSCTRLGCPQHAGACGHKLALVPHLHSRPPPSRLKVPAGSMLAHGVTRLL